MSNHGYETGRLDLPFVGVSTFAKRELVTDWSQINADVALLGAPFDFGTQWRAGARFGPRGIREASTLFSFGHAGAYDHEDDITYLTENVNIVDIGDADIIHTDNERSAKLFINHVLETVFGSSTRRTMYNLNLSTYGENSLNRIKLGPGLMVFLDQFKKQKFLVEWENAILQTENR